MQICDSCGSSFRIDYDDSDVAYERLSKEDELARQRFEHEKEMLETQYRLEEESRLKQAKYEKSEARKKRVAGKIGALITLLVMAAFFFGFSIFFYKLVKGKDLFSSEAFAGTTTTETTVSPYLISASDVTSDTEFMENAVASVLSEIRTSRNETVTTFDMPITDWYYMNDPEIYDCYLLVSEDGNMLYFLVKISYQSEYDEEDIQVIYDSLYIRNITVGKDGKLTCDYAVRSDRGEGATDWLWDGALDSDQLYRSAILAKSEFSRDKISVPESALPSQETEEEVSEDDEDDSEDYSDEDTEEYYEED